MKIIIPFILLSCTALAQGSVAVELEKVNLVYHGFDNFIKVVSDSVPDSCIVLRSTSARIEKNGPYSYSLIPFADSTGITIHLYDSCTGSDLGMRQYRVFVCEGEPLLGGQHYSKTMGTGEFKAQSGIAVYVKQNRHYKLGVVGFKVQFCWHDSGETITLYNSSARFSEAVSAQMKRVKPGDIVRFYNFSYQIPGRSAPHYDSNELVFKIK